MAEVRGGEIAPTDSAPTPARRGGFGVAALSVLWPLEKHGMISLPIRRPGRVLRSRCGRRRVAV